MSARKLIVNADDLGQTPGINAGIARAHEDGIVTSASLLVDGEVADEAARWAATRDLSVGLHVYLGEWRYDEGTWEPVGPVVDVTDVDAVRSDAERQLERFAELAGRGPTHIDSHQHVHRKGPAREVLAEIAARVGVPLRHLAPDVRYCGEFYGQDECGAATEGRLSVEGLSGILASLAPGVTELCCHPGVGADAGGMYTKERTLELEVLCDPRITEVLAEQDIELTSFALVAA